MRGLNLFTSSSEILLCVKLLNDFTNSPEFGIIGKAGTCYFPESGVFWERMNQTMVGQVYHHPENQKKWLSTYSAKIPYLIPVISIDGLFMAFNKTKIKQLLVTHYDCYRVILKCKAKATFDSERIYNFSLIPI